MSLATLLGAGQLMIIQAGVQSIVVTVLSSNLGYGVNRWLDAVVGCALALVVATIAPGSPLRKPGSVAAEVLREMARRCDAVSGRCEPTTARRPMRFWSRPGRARRAWPPSTRRPARDWPSSATPPSGAATCHG